MEQQKNMYANGKIYTIRSHQTDKYYIGSTTQPLSKRFYQHKQQIENHSRYSENYNMAKINGIIYNKKVPMLLSLKDILCHSDAYIELLEEYPCKNKKQLEKREYELIREHKDNVVNIIISRGQNN